MSVIDQRVSGARCTRKPLALAMETDRNLSPTLRPHTVLNQRAHSGFKTMQGNWALHPHSPHGHRDLKLVSSLTNLNTQALQPRSFQERLQSHSLNFIPINRDRNQSNRTRSTTPPRHLRKNHAKQRSKTSNVDELCKGPNGDTLYDYGTIDLESPHLSGHSTPRAVCPSPEKSKKHRDEAYQTGQQLAPPRDSSLFRSSSVPTMHDTWDRMDEGQPAKKTSQAYFKDTVVTDNIPEITISQNHDNGLLSHPPTRYVRSYERLPRIGYESPEEHIFPTPSPDGALRDEAFAGNTLVRESELPSLPDKVSLRGSFRDKLNSITADQIERTSQRSLGQRMPNEPKKSNDDEHLSGSYDRASGGDSSLSSDDLLLESLPYFRKIPPHVPPKSKHTQVWLHTNQQAPGIVHEDASLSLQQLHQVDRQRRGARAEKEQITESSEKDNCLDSGVIGLDVSFQPANRDEVSDDQGSDKEGSNERQSENEHDEPGYFAEDDKEGNDFWRPYDIFSVSERDLKDDNYVFKEILQAIRCSLYLVIILVMLAGTVASRLALFLLASDISQSDEAQGQSVVQLIFCICCPMLINWLRATAKILFSGKVWPSLKTFIVSLIIELLVTFSLCVLVFRIIPSTDFFRGITTTLAVFQIPTFLKLIMPRAYPESKLKAVLSIVLTILALLAQLGGPAFFLIMDFCKKEPVKTLSGISTGATPVRQRQDFTWEIPVTLVFVSLAWWENYVSRDSRLVGCFRPFLKSLQCTRETTYFLVAPFKMGLVVLSGRYVAGADFDLFSWSGLQPEKDTEAVIRSYSLPCIIVGSAILCTYIGGLACKLRMQKMAFALPLLLSPPASLLVVHLQCQYEFLPVSWHTGTWLCPSLDLSDLVQPLAVAAALWISYCVVVAHVWSPDAERLARTEKLFLTPHLTSIFPDFNLTLRRRRDDKHQHKKLDKSYTDTGMNNPSDDAEGRSGSTADGSNETTPMIYVCATMWHETRLEMTQLLKSLFRLDNNMCASRLAQAKYNIRDPDHFDMEIHIIFDDAFTLDKKANKFVPNSYVEQLIDCMEEAACSALRGHIMIPAPIKVVTPYGGRLVWTMPGQTQLVVHLKDKNKIRHRKRWSQVMYMYFLLGYRLLGEGDGSDAKKNQDNQEPVASHLRNRKKEGLWKRERTGLPLKHLLMRVPREKYEQIVDVTENTFILTLDGDVDFMPDSVKLLVDRMKKNPKVAAVCGRIHPIGSGPMVWYQQFEYAVSHWLQKAAEHVFGCVLCCPGCFSLLRASALMDDNVLKRYTLKATEARHFIQFDQGEDRWLCTLLLQQGYRIDYCAGADAYTFVPETFREFFNQRRRWSPSTMANIMDLLGSWRETVRVNDNISRLYVLFQFVILAAGILAPSTVIMIITGCYNTVLGISLWWSYVLSMLPPAFYVIVCLSAKTKTQMNVGVVLSALYTVVMMIAIVGTIISLSKEEYWSPSVLFISGIAAIFTTSALMHPQEMASVVFGTLYFLVIPTTFVLLTIYFICNLNNVSWGTREVQVKLTLEEETALKNAKKNRKKKSYNIFTARGLSNIIFELRQLVTAAWRLKNEATKPQDEQKSQHASGGGPVVKDVKADPKPQRKKERKVPVGIELNPSCPYWFQMAAIGDGSVDVLQDSEVDFWRFLMRKYLYPLDENKEEKERIADDLKQARNQVVFAYILVNTLWTVVSIQLQILKHKISGILIDGEFEPVSVAFLAVFAIVIFVQFVGMLVHRWGTFLHLMSSTRITWFWKVHSHDDFARSVVQEIQRHQMLEPVPDYEGDSDNYEDSSLYSDTEERDRVRGYDRHHYSRPGIYGPNRYNDVSDQVAWAHRWAHRPTDPGHFPRLEDIFEHRVDRMKQQQQHHRGRGRRTSITSHHSGWGRQFSLPHGWGEPAHHHSGLLRRDRGGEKWQPGFFSHFKNRFMHGVIPEVSQPRDESFRGVKIT